MRHARSAASGSRAAAAILRGAQHFTELRRDQSAIVVEFGFETRPGAGVLAAAHPRRQRTAARVAGGQHVSLERGDNLQLMFDVAQKEIGGREFAGAGEVEVAERTEALERRQGLGASQARITSAVDQDERLHDKF